jgi:predicted DNA-binding transcriptional regulator YafY
LKPKIRYVGGSSYAVEVRVSPRLIPQLAWHFGRHVQEQIQQAGPADGAGWVSLQLHFDSLEAARSRILDFGGDIEVLAPAALRASIQDFARQILQTY